MVQLTVSELAIYPVKSLRGVALSEMLLERRGPAQDRRFVVVDDDGLFLTQREHPSMCLIDVVADGAGWMLIAPEMPALLVDGGRKGGERRSATVWSDTVEACDMGDEAAAWFSAYLRRRARLCFMPDDSLRPVDPVYSSFSAAAAAQSGDIVSFADGFPILLIGAASLDEFNRALPEPIGSDRFRPNIVVAGAAPYAEDHWRRLRIGALEFDVVKPCSRCVIPSIDPRTARKQPIVAQTLARLRRRGDAVYFGQNVIQRGLGCIRVGDAVEVIA